MCIAQPLSGTMLPPQSNSLGRFHFPPKHPSHSHLKILLRYNGGAEVFRRTSFRAHGFPCDASAPHTEIRPALRANISETVLVLLINEQGEKEKGRDEQYLSWCSSLWGFGWRGTERRRAKR